MNCQLAAAVEARAQDPAAAGAQGRAATAPGTRAPTPAHAFPTTATASGPVAPSAARSLAGWAPLCRTLLRPQQALGTLGTEAHRMGTGPLLAGPTLSDSPGAAF